LLNYFLGDADRRIRLDDEKNIRTAIDLSAVGVLSGDPSTNEFWIPSPLIRSVIWSCLSIRGQLSVPPPINVGKLDVVVAIKTSLPLFNKVTMIRALSKAFKNNRDTLTDIGRDDQVPNEHAYQVELTLLLRKWFSNTEEWHIDTEVNSATKKCDIVVTNDSGSRYVIELIAHALPEAKESSSAFNGSLVGHYKRANDYRVDLLATEAWIVNFTTRHPSKGYLWPEKSLQVRAIHVYHKLDWTEARVVTSPDDKVGTLIKLG